jgi:Flp pilus assembly protein TadG
MLRKLRKSQRSRRNLLAERNKGQAMVEMALVATILLMLTFGTADLGLFMYKYVQAANCTREAARRAAVRKDPSNIPYCVDASLKPTVTYADPGQAAGSDVTATVNTTYSWIVIGYLVPGLGNTIPLKSATTMRLEGQKI